MNTYLLEVTIQDGEHEHRDFALIKAVDDQSARALGEEEASNETEGYWAYGDELTTTELRKVTRVLPKEAQVINTLGLAHYIK